MKIQIINTVLNCEVFIDAIQTTIFHFSKNPLLDKEEEVKRRMNDFDQRSLAGR